MQYTVIKKEDSTNVVAVVDGKMYTADDTHPYFEDILEALIDGDDSVAELFDLAEAISKNIIQLSERISIEGNSLCVDGDPISDEFCEFVVNCHRAGVDNWRPVVNFLEKLYTNVETHTRENLSRWVRSVMSEGNLTINAAGDLIGYKGVNDDYSSRTAGPGIVNGVKVNGHLDNSPDNVLEMARSQVEHNPAVGCASGLHVGTWDYASDFGSTVVEVLVNPRDVVSVPTDCNDQKMRVARYVVLREVKVPRDSTLAL